MTNQHTNQHQDPERVERSIRVWLTEGRPPLADRESQINDVLGRLDETPQTRARFLGRWFDRGRGVRRRTDAHDHPPDHIRRNRLMLSATGITAAIAVLALSVSGLPTDSIAPATHSTITHTVAADGTGDFATISEAIAAASDGQTVLVRPGTYAEILEIYDDITLTGDGPREDIVITTPGDVPQQAFIGFGDLLVNDTYGVMLHDSDAVLTGFTLAGDETTVVVDGGAPTLTGLDFDAVGIPYGGNGWLTGGHALIIDDGSQAQVSANTFDRSGPIGISGFSAPLIEGNTLDDGSFIWGRFGDGAVIRDNTITGAPLTAIELTDASDVLIEGNTISGAITAISGGLMTYGSAPKLIGNVIRDSKRGIQMGDGSEPTIRANDFDGVEWAILLSGTNAMVEDNTIHDGGTGVFVTLNLEPGFDHPTIRGNTIDVSGRAIDVGAGTRPIIIDNIVCGGLGVYIHQTANPNLGDNPSCEPV